MLTEKSSGIKVIGNKIIIPKGKGRDETTLEKALELLRDIHKDKTINRLDD